VSPPLKRSIPMIRNCRFAYKCEAKWEQLPETDDPSVRFCLDCEKEVHYCLTDEQLAEAIRLNRCVAVRLKLGDQVPMHTVGVPLAFKANTK